MAQKRFLYEILARGTPDGQLANAHQIWATAYTDDVTGEVVTVKHDPAAVLKVEDVKGLVSDSFVGLTNQIAELETQLEAEKANSSTLAAHKRALVEQELADLKAKAHN